MLCVCGRGGGGLGAQVTDVFDAAKKKNSERLHRMCYVVTILASTKTKINGFAHSITEVQLSLQFIF